MPLKIAVNAKHCQGHARCAAKAPEVYQLDEDGYAVATPRSVPAELEAQARDGARACPEHAIRIIQEKETP